MAKSQRQKSIRALHEAARKKLGIEKILEVSSKSDSKLGIALSAFNLGIRTASGKVPVECVFQGSKVFERGGPYTDMYEKVPREVKKDPRLRESGALRYFEWNGERWELEPKTAFYDWLYLMALRDNPELAERLLEYEAFTDIEFNPEKSINCQAHSAALYRALVGENTGEWRDVLDRVLASREEFLRLYPVSLLNPLPKHASSKTGKKRRLEEGGEGWS